MQDLTFPDIIAYVDAELCTQQIFQRFKQDQHDYADALVDDIAQKASGVFLWVILAVRSLVTGLTNGGRITDLQRRLAAIPPELDELYSSMLRTLEPLYLRHASEIFQIVRACPTQINLLDLAFTDEEQSLVGGDQTVLALNRAEVDRRNDIGMRRLMSRCKGLLEVSNLTGHEVKPIRTVAYDSPSFSPDESPDMSSDEDFPTRSPAFQSRSAALMGPDFARRPPRPALAHAALPTRIPRLPRARSHRLVRPDVPAISGDLILHADQASKFHEEQRVAPISQFPPAIQLQQAEEFEQPDFFVSQEAQESDVSQEEQRKIYPTRLEGSHHETYTDDQMDRIVEPVHQRLVRLEQQTRRVVSPIRFKTPWYYTWARKKLKDPKSMLTSNDEVERIGDNYPHTHQLDETPRTAALGEFSILKIGYIHKTAKDFMEQPENWRLILDGGEPNFSPELALLKSAVHLLRRLPPDQTTTATFWKWVTWCFECAAAAEQAGHAVEKYWLAHIDRTAAQTATSANTAGKTLLQINKDEIHNTLADWAVANTGFVGEDEAITAGINALGTKLITLCIQWNMAVMIEQMVECGTIVLHDKSGRPMLEYVWLGRGDSQDRTDGETKTDKPHESYCKKFPSSSLIRALLKGGADPNEWYANGTPWLRTLARMYKLYTNRPWQELQKTNDLQAWYDVYMAFIEGGADPRADLNCPSGSCSREMFEKWNRSSFKRLQLLMKAKQRKLPLPQHRQR